jgi:hypothetical protein
MTSPGRQCRNAEIPPRLHIISLLPELGQKANRRKDTPFSTEASFHFWI